MTIVGRLLSLMETDGLKITDMGLSGKNLQVLINGAKYVYTSTTADMNEIKRKFDKMLGFSAGKALAWLKKTCTLMQSPGNDLASATLEEYLTSNVKAFAKVYNTDGSYRALVTDYDPYQKTFKLDDNTQVKEADLVMKAGTDGYEVKES